MQNQYSYQIKKSIMLIDIFILFLCYFLAGIIRFGMDNTRLYNLYWILLLSPLTIIICFKIYGLYDFRYKTLPQAINKIFLSHSINFMLITLTVYLLNIPHFSRIFLVSFFLLSIIMHSIFRLALKKILNIIRKKGYNYQRALIVGNSEITQKIISSIEKNVHWGLRIIGVVKEEDDERFSSTIIKKYPIKGSLKCLKEIISKEVVDNVIFCPNKKSITDLKDIILDIETMGIASHIAIHNPAVRISSTFFGNIEGIPLITYSPIKLKSFQLFLKNFMDIIGGLVGFFIFLLLYPIVGIAIKLESPGPVLFKQKRMGLNNRIFTLYKFRSMSQDAEKQKEGLMAKNQLEGAVFKIKEDPRVTAVGRFLRKVSIDEWPQFINILKREMSLVGTRPPTLDEVEKYEIWQKRRLSMKPGLTGLWQVSGRNTITNFDEIVKLDLKYIDNWSIWYDFYIIFKTAFICMQRKGSY